MKRAQSGFTLIELMIVVAIIAILAAIAIPAYNQYIREANMTKVVDHADEGWRLAKAEIAKNVSRAARRDTMNAITEDYLIGEVNPESRAAPGANVNAFVAGSGSCSGVTSTTGQVCIQVTTEGTTATHPGRVTVWTPTYLDITETSVGIDPLQM